MRIGEEASDDLVYETVSFCIFTLRLQLCSSCLAAGWELKVREASTATPDLKGSVPGSTGMMLTLTLKKKQVKEQPTPQHKIKTYEKWNCKNKKTKRKRLPWLPRSGRGSWGMLSHDWNFFPAFDLTAAPVWSCSRYTRGFFFSFFLFFHCHYDTGLARNTGAPSIRQTPSTMEMDNWPAWRLSLHAGQVRRDGGQEERMRGQGLGHRMLIPEGALHLWHL